MSDELSTVIINAIAVIPPTLMALAALKSSKRIESQVETQGQTTLGEASSSQDHTLRIVANVLDRIDERLDTVETGVKAVERKAQLLADDADSHAAWHRKGQPERRKTP